MSSAMLGFIFGTFFGGLAMMVCITALIVAREADEREERIRKHDKDSNRTSTCPDDDIRSTLADSGIDRDRDDDIRTLEG